MIKTIVQVLVLIAFFLIIPEIIVRVLTAEPFARLSDFTSLGGILATFFRYWFFLGFFLFFWACSRFS